MATDLNMSVGVHNSSAKFKYKGIGVNNVIFTVPNGTGTALTSADVGKPVSWGTAGYELASDGEQLNLVMMEIDGDGGVTVSGSGLHILAMSTSAVAVGDFVLVNATGGAKPNGTSGSTTISSAVCVAVNSTTECVVKILG